MSMKKGLFTAVLIMSPLVSAISADMPAMKNPLSVHVLNLETGIPTAGIEVELDEQSKASWIKLATGVTDKNGRITALYPAGKTLTSGNYRVVFKTGDYYEKMNQKTFFPEIPVEFKLENSGEHYHIPLLLSPYGYSTYRGN